MPHKISLGISLFMLSASVVSAQTYTWTGGGEFDERWSNPANWLDGLVPTSSSTSTIMFYDQMNSDASSSNDLIGLEVGSIHFLGRLAEGNEIKVHQMVEVGFPPHWNTLQLPLELVGDVRFESDFEPPVPGSGIASPPRLRKVFGEGSATFEGSWQINEFPITGNVYVESNGYLSTYVDHHSFESIRVDGMIDLGGSDLVVPTGQVADFSQGALDLGRMDGTAGFPYASEATIEGDVDIGTWHIGGWAHNQPNGYVINDRLDVTGTLDLTQSHLTPTSYIDFHPHPDLETPEYFVLATYGNLIGTLDATTIHIIDSSGQDFGYFPIVYTPTEGPGEIRVMLPEPSILALASSAILILRRKHLI